MLDTVQYARMALLALLGLFGGLSEPPAAEARVGAPAAAAAADRAAMVGVGTHMLDRSSVQELRDLGVRHVRITLYWSHWHEPEYRREFAAGVRRADAAGLKLLVLVHQQPSGGYAQRQRVYRDFARFMADRVAEFPQVRYWQLWNEMDVAFTDVFGAGRSDVPLRQRGIHYAEMLALAYPAIKAANPEAVVVVGGIASAIRDGFLEGMYAGGARYDVLAIHAYGFPLWPSFRGRGREARALMRRHGDTRPLWNTEFGLEAAVVPADWNATRSDIDRFHLEAWRHSVEGNHRERIYDRVYGHVLRQGGDLSYDLVRSDGSPRPAYTWLRSWLRRG